jgi:hypothetical protein
MSFRNKVLMYGLGTLTVLAIVAGSVYAAKPGKCPPVRDYRLDRNHFIGVVYGGWMERMDAAVRDYKTGKIFYIMPTGNQWEIDNMKRHPIESGVPEDRLIEPTNSSKNTAGNVSSVFSTIRERGLPTDIRHYSSDEHLPRIQKNVDELNADSENDDGYLRVEDGYNNRLYGIPGIREWAACVRDR